MKMLMVILLLVMTAGSLCAQDARADAMPARDMGATETRFAFAVRPSVAKTDMVASRFSKAPTMARVALDGGGESG
ncbi:MAG: hypothetical protein WCB11_18060 [Terriglobales bacterium]